MKAVCTPSYNLWCRRTDATQQENRAGISPGKLSVTSLQTRAPCFQWRANSSHAPSSSDKLRPNPLRHYFSRLTFCAILVATPLSNSLRPPGSSLLLIFPPIRLARNLDLLKNPKSYFLVHTGLWLRRSHRFAIHFLFPLSTSHQIWTSIGQMNRACKPITRDFTNTRRFIRITLAAASLLGYRNSPGTILLCQPKGAQWYAHNTPVTFDVEQISSEQLARMTL